MTHRSTDKGEGDNILGVFLLIFETEYTLLHLDVTEYWLWSFLALVFTERSLL